MFFIALILSQTPFPLIEKHMTEYIQAKYCCCLFVSVVHLPLSDSKEKLQHFKSPKRTHINELEQTNAIVSQLFDVVLCGSLIFFSSQLFCENLERFKLAI